MYREYMRATASFSRFLLRATRVLALAACLAPALPALPGLAAAPGSLMLSELGRGRPGGCPSRWCACYLQKILRQAGYAVADSWRAIDWRSYGAPASPAAPGSIMVMRSHVGLVTGRCPDGRVKIVSGNHGHRVGVGCYPMNRAVAWRVTVSAPTLAFSMPAERQSNVETAAQPRRRASHQARHHRQKQTPTDLLILRRIAER